MAFIPHTEADVAAMLAAIGVAGIENLFDEIPPDLRVKSLAGVPPELNEMEIGRLMTERARADGAPLTFIGAGAYEHHIPAAVLGHRHARRVLQRLHTLPGGGEPGHAAADLRIPDHDCASDRHGGRERFDVRRRFRHRRGCTHGGARQPQVEVGTHPGADHVTSALPQGRAHDRGEPGTEVRGPALLHRGGRHPKRIPRPLTDGQDITALVIQQPNFFGHLEDVDALTDWAHARAILVIAVVNPTALALLKPPGQWGSRGADIAVGEGQPLGVPLCSGGPYFGFMTTRMEHVRQMPGRIVGRTLDVAGQPGFTLTLQAREQHIRRAKATSNICTNQGLLVTAATIYMSLMGAQGLARTAAAAHARTRELVAGLTRVPGVHLAFSGPYFHEAVLQLDRPVAPVLRSLSNRGILGGLDLSGYFPELGNALLVCATETKTSADIDRLPRLLERGAAGRACRVRISHADA